MKKLFLLLVVFLMVFASNSEAKLVSVNFEVKIGDRDKDCSGSGICSWKFTIDFGMTHGSNNGDTQIMQAKGEIRNNMFIVDLQTKMDEKGRDQQGKFDFSLSKEMILGQDLAKELGVEKLVLAPGKYELKGNTVSFKIVSPRGSATGQSNGKKSDIAVDESGVHKESAPKTTYDQKENNK